MMLDLENINEITMEFFAVHHGVLTLSDMQTIALFVKYLKERDSEAIRVIRFFCKECGKEIWQEMHYDNTTLSQCESQMICSSCLQTWIQSKIISVLE